MLRDLYWLMSSCALLGAAAGFKAAAWWQPSTLPAWAVFGLAFSGSMFCLWRGAVNARRLGRPD